MRQIIVPAFILAFALVFLGDLVYQRMNRKRQSLTHFQRFLFGTGFAYVVIVMGEIVAFFLDYYIPGFCLQGFWRTQRPAQDLLFFRIFGQGAWRDEEARRFALLELDLTFFYMMAGAAAAGFLLVLILEIKDRKKGDNGLLDGYRFEKMSPGAYIRREFREFRASIPVAEYLLWWAVRACMIWAIFHTYRKNPVMDITLAMLIVNFGMTFIIPIVRFLFFPKLFFGKIPFRVQTWISIFVFTGSFLGHGCGLAGTDFDKLQHVISGGLTIFIGYELICCLRKSAGLSRGTKVLGATGFSFVVMIVWEIFEFISDYLMKDAFNQNAYFNPEPDMFFYKLFGQGVGNEGQLSVLDTNIDLICALAGCLVCIAVLEVYLRLKERKAAKKAAEEQEKQAVPV